MAGIVIGGTGAKGVGGNKGAGKGGNKGGGKAANPFKGLTPGMQALTDPTQPALSGQNLINAAHAVANAQTVGPLGELARQIAQTNRGTRASERLTGGYFTQFGKSAQQGVTDEANIGQNLQTTLQGIGANTQTALQGIGQDAGSAVQKYMPAGDQGLSSPAMQSLTAEIARQRGYASQYGGIAQTSGALQSANYGGMAAAEKGIGAAAGTQALGELARAGRLAIQPLTSKEATLDQTRGALYANALSQIRQQGTTNLLTEQGLTNTANSLTNSALQSRLNRQFQGKQNKLSRQTSTKNTKITQAGETARSTASSAFSLVRSLLTGPIGDVLKTHAKGQSGTPLTPGESATVTNGITAAKSILTTYKGMSPAQLNELLTTGRLPGVVDTKTGKTFTLYSPRVTGGGLGPIAQAAHDLVSQGFLSQTTIAGLNAIGYQVGTRFPRRNTPGVGVGLGGQGIGGF